jgi:shikimate kinase
MRIVLLGYMGSGKSTVGKLLAQHLNFQFLDLDDYIESQLNASISSIFKDKGEIYFRKKETELLHKALHEMDNFVLSVGGGTPCYANNMNIILEETPWVFYLKCSIPTLVKRLSRGKEHRPLIAHLKEEEIPEFIGKHLFERSPFYSRAHKTILCDTKSAQTISTEIQNDLV